MNGENPTPGVRTNNCVVEASANTFIGSIMGMGTIGNLIGAHQVSTVCKDNRSSCVDPLLDNTWDRGIVPLILAFTVGFLLGGKEETTTRVSGGKLRTL